MLAIKTLCQNDKCHFYEKVDRWGWKLEKEVQKYQGDPRCPAPNPCHFWWRTYEEHPMHFLIEKYWDCMVHECSVEHHKNPQLWSEEKKEGVVESLGLVRSHPFYKQFTDWMKTDLATLLEKYSLQ